MLLLLLLLLLILLVVVLLLLLQSAFACELSLLERQLARVRIPECGCPCLTACLPPADLSRCSFHHPGLRWQALTLMVEPMRQVLNVMQIRSLIVWQSLGSYSQHIHWMMISLSYFCSASGVAIERIIYFFFTKTIDIVSVEFRKIRHLKK